MTSLLDVNVLIALIDPAHIDHDGAHDWFETEGHTSRATCPLTHAVNHSNHGLTPPQEKIGLTPLQSLTKAE